MAHTNPNHPWVGGPPYVNTKTGESRGTPLYSRLSLHAFPFTFTPFPSLSIYALRLNLRLCIHRHATRWVAGHGTYEPESSMGWWVFIREHGDGGIERYALYSRAFPFTFTPFSSPSIYAYVFTGTPPEGWQDMAHTNPNHPWVGGPPYVNTETGETREQQPAGWVQPSVGGAGRLGSGWVEGHGGGHPAGSDLRLVNSDEESVLGSPKAWDYYGDVSPGGTRRYSTGSVYTGGGRGGRGKVDRRGASMPPGRGVLLSYGGDLPPLRGGVGRGSTRLPTPGGSGVNVLQLAGHRSNIQRQLSTGSEAFAATTTFALQQGYQVKSKQDLLPRLPPPDHGSAGATCLRKPPRGASDIPPGKYWRTQAGPGLSPRRAGSLPARVWASPAGRCSAGQSAGPSGRTCAHDNYHTR
jgi:hypothetical protein